MKKTKTEQWPQYYVFRDNNNNFGWENQLHTVFQIQYLASETYTLWSSHGLQSLEFSRRGLFNPKAVEMFFGEQRFIFNLLTRTVLKDNYLVYPLLCAQFCKGFQSTLNKEQDYINLSYDQNFLSLEFAALELYQSAG